MSEKDVTDEKFFAQNFNHDLLIISKKLYFKET